MAADEHNDTTMADTSLEISIDAATKKRKLAKEGKARELFGTTLRQPPFAYAHVEVVRSGTGSTSLDALQIRGYCESALKQFLGATGAGMPFDLLKIDGSEFWLRLPSEDLSCFAASLTAWVPGSSSSSVVLRLRDSGNWLGSLVGRSEQQALWNDT
ncbi:hypothetical protein F503_07422 [Ophiostoma piceae UAMH 11346]|uniref:Ribonucleases P/MRP subunit Pop8-like domain-containing protein n=1 Tax=Ophiostoma piceae (strain UAMH 11346) TaxID=1262450 RepID=S3CCE0_OPHP1|nr:hypothetical protein F503_07422 [Ophiostoma piceae UAMH 11346]